MHDIGDFGKIEAAMWLYVAKVASVATAAVCCAGAAVWGGAALVAARLT